MNQYMIPANSKKGQLIFNIFRPIDLAVLICGIVIALPLMIILPGDEIWQLVVKLLPIGIAVLLVVPLANYHNVLVFLQEMFLFYSGQKEYHWKGWCARDDIDEQRK